MSLIREALLEAGWSQRRLAEALHVTPSTVSQWLASEDAGTIRLDTLTKALAPLHLAPALQTAPTGPLLTIRGDMAPADHLHTDAGGIKGAMLNARFGNRIPNIAGDAYNLPLPLTAEQLWLVADHITVETTLDIFQQATHIRDDYDHMLRLIAENRWTPHLALPDGRRIPVEDALTGGPRAALGWAWRGIRNGANWLEAWRAGCAALIMQGYDWPTLPAFDDFTEAWHHALGLIRSIGDATYATQLVADLRKGLDDE